MRHFPARQSAAAERRQAPEPDSRGEREEGSGLGNLAMQRLVGAGLRARLEVGGAGDPEERSADRLAAEALSGSVRSPCACGGRCGSCAGGPKLRRKPQGAGSPPAAAANAAFAGRSGRPLDSASRNYFEPRLGVGLDGVRIHDDGETHRFARGIGARAFAMGADIGFAEGRHSPGTAAGRELLAHELAHVALGHGGTRRRTDMEAELVAARAEKRAEDRARADERHRKWSGAVDTDFGTSLSSQSKTVGDERERMDIALLAQRARVLDAAAAGEGWLGAALAEQGYSGPGLAAVRASWGEAVVAAESLSVSSDGPDGRDRLTALQTVPAFYSDLLTLSEAIEQAQRKRHEKARDAALEKHARDTAAYERQLELQRDFAPRGEPGAGAAMAGMAIARGPPPPVPTIVAPPTPISGGIAPARERLASAQTKAQWMAVTGDVRTLGAGLSKLVAFSLPETSEARIGMEYVGRLADDLEKFEKDHPLSWRVPATFYPLDQLSGSVTGDGISVETAKSIPWQFYLTNTGLRSRDGPVVRGGQWVLTDLTAGRGFKNVAPTSDFDLDRLQRGEAVDPPVGLFAELNESIRFPEGRLYFMLPSGSSYVLTTTEPVSLSDFLAGLGLAFAAVALVAGVVASGGAATPLAVAGYAAVGAAAAGVGSTLADLHEKSMHGVLTGGDVDKAMVSIGLDLLSAATGGLGRIVGAAGAAARFGNRFVLLSRITKVAQAANLIGDLYQAVTVSESFLAALSAIDRLPEDQRDNARAQLVRRAMLTGALMTVAIRGDIGELTSGGGLRVARVDPDGALVTRSSADAGAADIHPRPGDRTPVPHSAPHAEVTAPVHAAAGAAGTSLVVGKERHALGVAGSGQGRDFYFCSDRCTALTARLAPIVDALPKNHPMRPAFADMLAKAREAREALLTGKMSQADAEAFADGTVRRINALVADTNDGPTLARLLDMDPHALDKVVDAESGRIAREQGIQLTFAELQAERQAAARHARSGFVGDPKASPEASDIAEAQGMGLAGPSPRAPKTELYSPMPAAKPLYPGGIPPAEGGRITATLRDHLGIPAFTGQKGDPNVAVAEVHINGERQLLTTVSGGEVRPGMVELPDKTRFRLTGSGFQTRAQDTERKLLEHVADRISPDAKGVINLFTERAACPWCNDAIAQFKQRFPGVDVIITHYP